MGPIDYLGAVPQQDFLKDIQGGLQIGMAYRQNQVQQQQQQLALQRAQQYQADAAAFMQNPNPQAAAALALKYPDQSEPITKVWAGLNADQQKNELKDTYTIASTLHADRPDLALQQIDQRIEAMKNSGQSTAELEALRGLVDKDPRAAYAHTLAIAARIPGGDKILTSLEGINKDARDQAESDSKVAGQSADLALKNLSIVGQTLGALQGKNIKPAQAVTALKSLAAKGAISKDELPDYLATVPSDPKQLDEWLGSMKLAGMKPDDQMKYSTPDANTVANNTTSRANTRDNNATQLAVQDRIAARQESKGDTDPTLDADTLTTMAAQYLAGDKSVMQNLGRGAQGSANIVALRQEITKQAKAQGMSGPAIAAAMADYVGTLAGQRTAGTRIANVEMASDEAQRLIPLAQQASADVARSGLLPFGKVQNMFDDQTNNPALRRFAAANNALVNVYSRAISPGGVATVSDKEHARHMLSTAMDHKSYLAVLDQMQREIQAAREAPQAVRGAFRDRVTGGAAPASHSAIPAGWTVKEH